jgi:hypothetical protein
MDVLMELETWLNSIGSKFSMVQIQYGPPFDLKNDSSHSKRIACTVSAADSRRALFVTATIPPQSPAEKSPHSSGLYLSHVIPRIA